VLYPQTTDSSKDDTEEISKLLKRYKTLQKSRVNWHTIWQDVGDYVVPNKDNIYRSNVSGEKKTNYLFDASATRYNRTFANNLYSTLTNSTTKWFELSTGDPRLDSIIAVKKWLQSSEERMRGVLNASNFTTEIHSVYEDLPSFGTAILYIQEDKEEVVRFQADQIYTAYISENNKGMVDEIFRCFKWDYRQIVREFGEDWMNDECRREYEDCKKNGTDKKFEVVQAIVPSDESGSMKYIQYYILEHKKIMLEETKFESFPAAVPRLVKLSDEIYGRSPAIDSMPDIKTLNQMKKIVIVGGQLAVAPPFQAPDNSLVYPANFKPYGMNYRRPGSEKIEPLITGARPDIGLDLIKAVQEDLKEAFYYNQIHMVENDRMTATEIMQRRDEQFRSFGAILGRLNNELLKPVIDRTFMIMAKKKMFDELPAELQKLSNISIRYTSMIARAQSSMEAEPLNRALQASATILQAQPQTLDYLDGDKVLKKNMNVFGADHSVLKTDAEVKKIREDRAKQQQAEAQAQAQKDQAETMKTTAQAGVGQQ
jgi:hypothetical protein